MMISRFTKPLLISGGAILAAAILIVSAGARTTQEDTAALYKSKCVACHGATAEKKFDTTKSDDDLIQVVLKGKKLEKPPNMHGFEEKGITLDQAKSVVAHMKSLRQ